jgi:hypothetical protein
MFDEYRLGLYEGKMNEQERIIKLLEDRFDDLSSCNKLDDCNTKAEIIGVVIDDIKWLSQNNDIESVSENYDKGQNK